MLALYIFNFFQLSKSKADVLKSKKAQ